MQREGERKVGKYGVESKSGRKRKEEFGIVAAATMEMDSVVVAGIESTFQRANRPGPQVQFRAVRAYRSTNFPCDAIFRSLPLPLPPLPR